MNAKPTLFNYLWKFYSVVHPSIPIHPCIPCEHLPVSRCQFYFFVNTLLKDWWFDFWSLYFFLNHAPWTWGRQMAVGKELSRASHWHTSRNLPPALVVPQRFIYVSSLSTHVTLCHMSSPDSCRGGGSDVHGARTRHLTTWETWAVGRI
jgi:hypothetical protein